MCVYVHVYCVCVIPPDHCVCNDAAQLLTRPAGQQNDHQMECYHGTYHAFLDINTNAIHSSSRGTKPKQPTGNQHSPKSLQNVLVVEGGMFLMQHCVHQLWI